MKNILFVTEQEISPLQGGTERITHTLSNSFRSEGCQCFLAYLFPESNITTTDFDGKIQLDTNDSLELRLKNFLEVNQIDIIISNLVRYKSKKKILPTLYNVTRSHSAKLIVCYHAMPGEDLLGTDIRNAFYRILHGKDVLQAFKDLVLGFLPNSNKNIFFKKRLEKKYRLSHFYSDKLVLLSERFYKLYAEFANVQVDDKFYAIPNALSFDTPNFTANETENKSKEVLILARMHERSKRLSSALKIWSVIESKFDLSDWKLTVVGAGPDMDYYKNMAKKATLTRIQFLGRQPEIECFYRRATIFMMTSNYEGFGITLTEAQQFGVIPVAFDSFASLSDIIENNKNGLIIPNNDINAYVNGLSELMQNDSKRMEMATNALESCKRFSQEKITQKWLRLFDDLLIEK